MTAENIFSIIQAMDVEERKRLYAMLKKAQIEDVKQKQSLIGWSEKEIKQKLLSTIFKTRRNL